MTHGIGTKSIPKDLRFESILRKQFRSDKFEKIIYYDASIIVKDGKRYGKIIICDDSIYYFIDKLNSFTMVTLFKDIISVEMISDKPSFIIGHMKKNTIHIRIKSYKNIPLKSAYPNELSPNLPMLCTGTKTLNSPKSSKLLDESQTKSEIDKNNSSTSEEPSKSKAKILENTEMVADSIDFYILNINSPAFHLIKKARSDYLIRETMKCSISLSNKSLHLSPSLLNRLFGELLFDIMKTENSIIILQNNLLELIESGLKYYQIKVLFWSKPVLFKFIVTQFIEKLDMLFNLKKSKENTNKELTYTYMSLLNVILTVLNTYLFETDHFAIKSEQLGMDNGKLVLSLIKSDISLISYLNDSDKLGEPDGNLSDLEVNIDCLKHSITMSSVQLLYHLLSTSEISFCQHENDFFSIRNILCLFESLVDFQCSDGIFNKFINQVLQMQFVWIFPKMFKIDDLDSLSCERVINIYQFFTSLKILIQCMPKFLGIFRREMEEEFEHFILCDLSFPIEFPLSLVTLNLLKSFQMNMINKKDVFIDYY